MEPEELYELDADLAPRDGPRPDADGRDAAG